MKPYAEYKPTGLKWLPEVPTHWDVRHIGELFSERKTKVSDKDFAPLSVTRGGIVPQMESVAKSDDGDNRKLVRKGDFVINSRSDRKSSSGVSDLDGSVSLVNIVLTPRNQLIAPYVHYLLKSFAFAEEFYRNGHGIVADLWTTRYSEMKSISLPVPPPEEQAKIVSYLDAKTAKIDKLVKLREREIELKKEELNILLFDETGKRTVFRGWDEAFPASWKREKIRHLFVERNEKGFLDKELLAVSQTDGVIFKKDAEANYVCTSDYRTQKLVCENDYIISLRAFQGGIETSYIEGLVSAAYNVFHMVDFDKELHSYYRYLFKSPIFISHLNTFVQDMRDGKNIKFNDVRDCLLPQPPRNHIERVAKLGDSIKRLEAFAKKEKALLKEYRTRLISDAVTGKIDLREVAG